jgi:hypothetical protein
MTRLSSAPINTVNKCAVDLVKYLTTRDRHRIQFEKLKLLLLVVFILSGWFMFFFLSEKLDDLRPAPSAPVYHERPFAPLLPYELAEPSPHYLI